MAVPVNTIPPTISGTAEFGQTLTASTGTWTNSPTVYNYQWARSGLGAIPGATASNYVPVTADVGHQLEVFVDAGNSSGYGTAVSSAPTSAVVAAPVTIPGTAQVGQTLTAAGGIGTYQWYNEGAAISGATSSTYVLQGVDQGCLIQVLSGGVFSALVGPVIGTTVIYVSQAGNDTTGNGSISAPYKSLAKVNGLSLSPGTSVLLRRGDTWRNDGCSTSVGTQISPSVAGTAGSPIVFDAYGSGADPIIDGSYDLSQTSDWQGTGTTNVWESVHTFSPISPATQNGKPNNQANDVGNLIWGVSPIGGANVPPALVNANYGVMTGGGTGGVWYLPGAGTAGLTSSGQWNFNADNYRVQVYCVGNPATVFTGGLRAAIDTSCIYPNGNTYLIIQNLTIQFSGASPINSNNANNNIIVRDSVIQWSGGGNISGNSNADSRYGDGIDIEGSTTGWLVERTWFHQIYDVGIGPQCGGAHQDGITIRNCVFSEIGGGFASFLFGPPYPTASGLNIYNNTVYCTQNAWSNNPSQRPNGAENVDALYLGVVPVSGGGGTTQSGMIVRNNIFAGIGGIGSNPGFGLVATQWRYASNPSNPFTSSGDWMDYDCWPKNIGTGNSQQIALHAGNYTIQSWATGTSAAGSFTPALEVNGIFDQDPLFTSQSALNFSLQSGSPCRNSGVNLYGSGVVWDFNKNPRPASGAFSMGAFQ